MFFWSDAEEERYLTLLRELHDIYSRQEVDKMDYVIETEDLTKKFPGGVLAVDKLNLKVKQGEVFGFLGPNGAGKTTSIRMIVGLLKPTSGKVMIKGQKIEAASWEVKKNIGVCPQEIVVWEELTCLENLVFMGEMYGLSKSESKRRGKELLGELKLEEKTKAQAGTLSGGMKRRLNMGMALVHNPEIVVLDEPTAGVDPQSRVLVYEYISRLGREENKTIILTTHLMEVADKLSKRVAIIDHGKLLICNSPENLKNEIGKGDALELLLADKNQNDQAVEVIKKMRDIESVNIMGGMVVLRALDAINKMPGIFDSLGSSNIKVANMTMRRNTLEDVFINLTGRDLREG
jgi:ABC-2 type transport system ATP-binding protein